MNNKVVARAYRLSLLLLTATCLTAPHVARAQLVAADKNTGVYNAPNGVPIVDIAKANAAGLSHNRFTDYNVDSHGLVLNNGNSSQFNRQSQLAGQVTANLNLTDQAKLILNEVVSTRRSSLAGYTEVVGGKADVVVANPNGITCNGCGFINTSNTTLTTGKPRFATDGSLSGFQVNKGDILVIGKGLDGTAQDYTALVARSVKVDGQINAKNLDVVTGANDWDYKTHTATARTPDENAPLYAIDSSALGGMYANRIRLIATEHGVGVRMAGDAAASDDFTIDASGKVELGSQISSAHDVRVSTTATGADAIHATNVKLSATHDVALSATGGELHLDGGLLTAGNDMTLSAASLKDSATTDTAADNNKRYAAHNLTFTTTGAAAIDGTVIGAGEALSGNVGSMTVNAIDGATLYSGTTTDLTSTGALALNNAAVKSHGDLTITSSSSGITVNAGAGQGVESVTGAVILTAASDLTNGGVITSDAGSVTANANGTITNTGTLHAAITITVADKNGAGTEAFNNIGTVLADGSLTAKAAAMTNSGNMQGTLGSTVTATSLNNTGTFIASGNAAHSATITLDSLTNGAAGILQSAKDLTLNIKNSLTNSHNLLATGDVSIIASDSGTTLSVTNNSGGTIQAGGTLLAEGTVGAHNLSIASQAGKMLGNNVTLITSGLTNSGVIQADVLSSINNTGTFTNSGTVLGNTTLTVASDTLANSSGGILQGTQGSTLSGTTLNNSGTIVASNTAGHAGSLTFDAITNSASSFIQSADALNLTAKNTLTNTGTLIGTGNVTIRGENGTTLAVVNNTNGVIQSGAALDIKGYNGSNALSFNTQVGKLLGNNVTLITSGLTNSGAIQADVLASLTNTGTFTNSGTVLGKTTLTVASDTVTNSSGGILQGTQGAILSGTTLNNGGTIVASNTSGHSGSLTFDALTNSASSYIQSADALNLTAKNTLTNTGTLIGIGNVTIRGENGTALAVVNNTNGIIQSGATLDLKGYNGTDAATLATQNGKLFGDTVNLNLSSLTNSGAIQGGSGASNITVTNTLTNNSGAKVILATNSAGSGTVNAATIDNTGLIQSQGALALNVTSNLYNRASANILSGVAMVLRGLTSVAYAVHNYGLIQAGGLLDIKGQSAGNAVNIYTDSSSANYIGDTMALKAGMISLADGSGMTAANGMTINANTLSMGGQDAFVVSSSGLASITLANAFANYGTVYSGGNLTFRALSINNTGTGALASGATLDAGATGGNFDNYGALYAHTMLTASATNSFTNEDAGTLDSDYDIGITANTFTNYNKVNALHNLSISALYFYNEITGGDQRHTTTSAWVTTDTGWSNGDPCSTSSLCTNDTTKYYTAKRTVYQSYYNTPTHKPELIAAGTLTINNFQTGLNLGGIISAPTVNISSSRGGATFTNDDYSLTSQAYKETWDDHGYCLASELCFYYYTVTGENDSGVVTDGSPTVTPFGAGIFAGSLNASGFGLTNAGTVVSATVHTTDGDGADGTTLATGASTVSGTTAANGTTTASATGGASGTTGATGASSFTFGGVTITLPTNPNGYFVISKDPNSKYLIETNPRYTSGEGMSSDYLAERLGINPETIQRRLGDGNYEASIIRDELVAATGSNILVNGENEAQQMQRLMDQGVDTAKSLGLTYGSAPTAAQIANLKQDIVWMVSTKVNGQDVLAPVVYLSKATRDQIKSGAVIASNDTNMNLDSLTNTGGTISGSHTLNVTSKGDITNTSGTISGGDVSLASTSGSIINQTYASTTGNDQLAATVLGNTAGITATGGLNLNAAKDITNLGANMSAGGDANLKAGNNITFDTIQDKEASTTHTTGGSNGLGGKDHSSTSDSSTTNVKSDLTVGGNMTTSSGKDTTFAGTDVNVKGNADVKAGGDLNIIDRQDNHKTSSDSESGNVFNGNTEHHDDTKGTSVASNFNVGGNLNSDSGGDTTIRGSNVDVKGNGAVHAGGDLNILDGQNTDTSHDTSAHTGAGVGGGVYGTTMVSDTGEHERSVASNMNFGGNGSLTSDKTLTVQGSNVGTGGDLNMAGKDVQILEGRNNDKTTHSEGTVTFLKVDPGKTTESHDSKSGSSAGTEGQSASAGASASANSDRGGEGGLALADASTTTTTHDKSTASSSNIHSGGNTTIKGQNDVTIRGSNVDAGGDVDLSGKNVNILAAENKDETTTTNTDNKVGFFAHSDNHAGASADANAQASAKDNSASATSEANANAKASTENTLNYSENTSDTTNTKDITHTGSSIKSGGGTKIKADDQLNVNGSSIDAGGDVDLKAKDMSFTAAQDSHTETKSSSSTSVGSYYDGSAEANANANAGAKGVSAGAGVSADAEADAGVGFQASHNDSSSTNGTTTAQVSSIKSGGNMTREATGKITDEGTQIDAGGDFTQKANEWDSKAAKNTTFSTDSSETNTGKLGIYGSANAGADYGASTTGGVTNENGADASAGIEASYNRDKSSNSSDSSHAVVSNIKSGGKMTTTTTGKTSLEGTNLESGGDMDVNAGSLDYKAAHDTESSSKDSNNINAGGKVGLDATKEVTASVEGGYGSDKSSESSSTAQVGSMKSGGNMHVNTTGDANFEGTNLDAKGDAGIKAGGDVNFKAAHNTSTSSEEGLDVSGSASASKGKSSSGKGKTGMGVNLDGSYSKTDSSSDDAVAGSIKSGGNIDVSSGKSATFEGTKLASGGDTSVDAKDNVNFNAAKSTSSTTSWGVDGSLSASKGGKETSLSGKTKEKGTSGGLEVGGNYSKDDETKSDAASVDAGGKVKVKSGNDVNLEGTNITSKGSTMLDAGHDVNFKAATDTSNTIGVEGSIGGDYSKDAQKAGKPKETVEKGGDLSLDVEGGKSTTKKAGSINAGSIDIKSGNDSTLEGTKLNSKGDTSIDAGGNVNLNTAKSSHIDGGIGGSVGSGGGGLTKAGIDGGVTHDAVGINSGGDTNIKSNGKTSMTGTQINADGNATINAKGGVDKQTAVSGGAGLGMDHANVDLDVQKTEINAKGNIKAKPETGDQAAVVSDVKPVQATALETKGLQDSVAALSKIAAAGGSKADVAATTAAVQKILNDPKLTTAQKQKLIQQMTAQLEGGKGLTSTETPKTGN